jgi:uncharacterized membrane protein YkvA (DUF1232 family)
MKFAGAGYENRTRVSSLGSLHTTIVLIPHGADCSKYVSIVRGKISCMYHPSRRLTLLQKVRIVWMAFVDKRTSLLAKTILGGGMLYGILPLDLIPDVLPLLGITDDAGILLVTLFAFLRMTKSLRIALENEERYGNKPSSR